MSGHSRWAGIKHKKGLADAKRGKLFTKIIREISIAAKIGGGQPDSNPRLRKAMEDAREANMPADNMKKAIQRGTGELPGVNYEEMLYEGYGPSGVAVMVEVTTDNKNRTAGEIRRIFSSHGGNLGETGSVGWVFSSKGLIMVEKSKAKEDALMDLVLEAGAEDLLTEDPDVFEITTPPADFEKVKKALDANHIPTVSAEVTMVPKTTVKLAGGPASQMLALMNALEEHDDVKNVYANFDIPKDIIENAIK
ncbi:MAG: transcriptional regulator [Elusimicrobia bacterium RIFCSPLOWO2_01_FULL_59_12]|nr:MAG: transcriptional regulator [Elusimicrobia bacterium RIFCSPLOWO2_01_FULL_59_12]